MKRIRSLDILKFIMAILIVFHHYQQNTGLRGQTVNFYEGTIYWGSLVELFFIISGFLAAAGTEKIRGKDFKQFITGKILRIYPMAMLSVLAMSAAGFLYVVVWGKWYNGVRITIWKLWNSLLMTVTGGAVNDGTGINGALWYLCVLMYCYVIMYFIIWFCSRKDINCIYGFAIMSIMGLSLLQYEIKLPFLNEYTGRGYSSFFLGMLLFYIWNTVSHRAVLIYSASVLAICIVVYFGAYSLFAANMREMMTYIIFPAVLFLTLSADRFFDKGLTDKTEPGGMAYEIYLWHDVGICIWMVISKKTGIIDLDDYGMMFVFAGIMVIFSALMYHLAEKNITLFLKRRTK